MVHRGLSAHIGAHGEPPLGLLYHKEMAFAKAGGLDNYEVDFNYIHIAVFLLMLLSLRLFVLRLATRPRLLV